MKPSLGGEFAFTLALGLFVVAVLAATLQFPMMLRYTPFIAGGLTLTFILVLLAGTFEPRILRWTETALQDLWGGGSGDRQIGDAQETPAPWPAVLRVLAYTVGFLLSVYFFGFFVVPPVFVALYLILDGKVKPVIAIAIAVVACGAMSWSLSSVNVDLWAGVVPEIIPGYLGGAIPPQF